MTTNEPAADTARRRRTRERLADAGKAVFAEDGFHAASVESIAERAGFTRGAFYSNFDSKESLFFAIAEREHRRALDRLEAALVDIDIAPPTGGAQRGEAELAALIGQVFDPHRDERSWCVLEEEFRLLAMRDPDIAARFREHEQGVGAELATVVQAALAAAGLRPTMPTAELTRLLVGAYTDGVREALLATTDQGRFVEIVSERAMRILPGLVLACTEPVDAG